MFTKSKCPSVAHWALTVAPSCSTSRLTSRIRAGLFLTVCTPSGVRVESMMYVGMRAPPMEVLERDAVLSDPFLLMRCCCIPVDTFSRMFGRTLAATALVLGVQAAPAAAAAIAPLKSCYVSAGEQEQRRETIAVRGTGFTANSTVDIAVDGVVQVSGNADALGEFDADAKAPHQPQGQRPFTVTVAERGNPANV